MASKSTAANRQKGKVMAEAVESEAVIYDGEPAFLANAARSYLETVKKITAFNEKHKPSDAEWTTTKLVGEAKKIGDDDTEVGKLLKEKQDAHDKVTEVNGRIAKFMAGKLNVSFQEEAPEPDKATVEALKAERAAAAETAKAIWAMVSGGFAEESEKEAVSKFISDNTLPGVGRNQQLDVTSDVSSAPKYRVDVTILNSDGEVLHDKVSGFTKAVQAVSKEYKNVEKAKRLTAEQLRDVYEKGETEFSDNGLTFKIEKRAAK